MLYNLKLNENNFITIFRNHLHIGCGCIIKKQFKILLWATVMKNLSIMAFRNTLPINEKSRVKVVGERLYRLYRWVEIKKSYHCFRYHLVTRLQL